MKNKVSIVVHRAELSELESVRIGISRTKKAYRLMIEADVLISFDGMMTLKKQRENHIVSADELTRLVGAVLLGGIQNMNTGISFDLIDVKEA